jgi:hypothetical protein
MDFSAIFQIRTKRFWWMDVIFYFVISLLIATIFSYVIFLVKNNFQREDIKKETAALETVGTAQQKSEEQSVIGYQKKISDFTNLLKNHEFASNVFAFMEAQTLPNVWFKQFSLDEKSNGVQLSGESDDLDALSRQVASFERNKYVKNISTLNSALGESARITFNIDLLLDQSIFGYISTAEALSVATSPSTQPLVQQSPVTPAVQPSTTPGANTQQASQPGGETQSTALSSEKAIISFNFLASPEIVGIVDNINFIVTLNVPYGTNIENLTPLIVVSPGATIIPASNVAQDFISPVAYRVTAQDGSIQNYTAKVIVQANPEAGKNSGYGLIILIAIASAVIIIIAVVVILLLRKRNKGQKSGKAGAGTPNI